MAGSIVRFVSVKGSASGDEIVEEFAEKKSDGTPTKKVVKSTVGNLVNQRQLRLEGDVYVPANPVPLLSYDFMVPAVSVFVPFAGLVYAIAALNPALFVVCFLMLAVGLGSIVRTAL